MKETTRIENKAILTPELDIDRLFAMRTCNSIGKIKSNRQDLTFELMRIYRDVELVESLGSGIPRILNAYGKNCFKFTDNFIRITFPVSVQAGTKSAPSWH